MHKILKGVVVVAAVYGAAQGANQLYSNVFKFGDPTTQYQISELKTNVSELRASIADIQIQADVDRRNIVVAQKWETVREVDLAKSKDDLALAAQDLEQKASEINALKKDNKTLAMELDEVGQSSALEIEALQAKIVEIGTLLDTQTEQAALLVTALEKGNQGLLRERKKSVALNKDLDQFVADLAMLEKQNQTLNADLQSQSIANELALTAQVKIQTKTQTELELARAHLAKTTEQIAQLEQEVVMHKNAMQKAQASYQESLETIGQLETKLNQLATPKIAALDDN